MGNLTFEFDQQRLPNPAQEIDPNQEAQISLSSQYEDFSETDNPYYLYDRVPLRNTIQLSLEGLLQLKHESLRELASLRQTILYSRLRIDIERNLTKSLQSKDFWPSIDNDYSSLNSVQYNPNAMNLKEFQVLFPIKKRLGQKDKKQNSSKLFKRMNQISSARNKIIQKAF